MARFGKASGGGLSRALDKEVYQVIRKLQDDAEDDGQALSISSVYDKIQRSNSSLKRRPKLVLEDAIERILATLATESSDSDATEPQPATTMDHDASDAMNRHMRKSLAPSKASSQDVSASEAPIKSQQSHKRLQQSPTAPVSSKKAKRQGNRDAADFAPPTNVSLEDVGGLGHVIKTFKDNLILPLLCPQLYVARGLKIPRGVLLHGPPGCGKTLLAEAFAGSMGLPFLSISAPSIVSGMSGESEKQLRQHFEHAVSLAPCLMFIDEIDTITPKRDTAQREMERRIVGQLLTCLDDIDLDKTGGKPVVVLAATNRPDSIDPALRRAGRFDMEIEVGAPKTEAREQILKTQTRNTKLSADVDIARLASLTAGYVGADLAQLVTSAGSLSMSRLRAAMELLVDDSTTAIQASRQLTTENGHADSMELDQISSKAAGDSIAQGALKFIDLCRKQILPPGFEDDAITMADFLAALQKVQPSAKREGFTTVPDTTWASIGAMDDIRDQLMTTILRPIQHPELYKKFNAPLSAGILLYGPPGCGKTLLAKAVANESRANFISVKGPELLNKYFGESERAIRQMFGRAAASAPCVIFFDEVDALIPNRDDKNSEASSRVVAQLLTELDGLGSREGIYVIAATNRPDMIDQAMLRPGRFGKHLFVGLPSAEGRVEILKTQLQGKVPANFEGMEDFVRTQCGSFSGADIHNLVDDAVHRAIDRHAPVLELCDLLDARRSIVASVTEQQQEKFKSLAKMGISAFRNRLVD